MSRNGNNSSVDHDPTLAVDDNSRVVSGLVVNLLGLPGCGKNAQETMICNLYPTNSFGMSDSLRAQLSSLGETERETIISRTKQGYLVPDEIILPVIEEAFKTHFPETNSEHGQLHIFNGVTRSIPQAQQCFEKANQRGLVFMTIFLDTRVEECNRRRQGRWSEQKRPDDNPEIFKVRVKEYKKHTLPCVDFFRQKATSGEPCSSQFPFYHIKGDLHPDSVFTGVCQAIQEVLGRYPEIRISTKPKTSGALSDNYQFAPEPSDGVLLACAG
jgi:adenylate kinase family enzyme